MAFLAKLSTRERRALYIAVGLVTLVLLDRFIIKPTWAHREAILNEAKQISDELKVDYAYYLNREKEINADYQRYEKYIIPTQSVGTDVDLTTELIKRLETLGGKTGLKIEFPPGGATRPRGTTDKYVVRIDYVGRASELAAFLYEVSNAPCLLQVEKIELTLKGPLKPTSEFLKGSAQISQTVIP